MNHYCVQMHNEFGNGITKRTDDVFYGPYEWGEAMSVIESIACQDDDLKVCGDGPLKEIRYDVADLERAGRPVCLVDKIWGKLVPLRLYKGF